MMTAQELAEAAKAEYDAWDEATKADYLEGLQASIAIDTRPGAVLTEKQQLRLEARLIFMGLVTPAPAPPEGGVGDGGEGGQ